MRNFLIILLIVTLASALLVRIRYGGGEPYSDVSTTPVLPEAALQEFLRYPEPIGNVAAGPDGRVFFTVHPESRPQGNRLLEFVDGAAVPYPSGSIQPHLFDTVLGLAIDGQNRLWTIDNGNHGFGDPRLIAFDLENGELVVDHIFSPTIAPAGSFLQDLQVTNDGRTVIVADASVWRKQPALVIYDVESRTARRVLESHPSVSAENFLIRNHLGDMSYFGGIVNLKTGIDGITLDENNEWLYYAAINNSALYRVHLSALLDPALPGQELAGKVERFSTKPLNDGLETDANGNIYITDVEHGSVFVVDSDRNLKTLIQSRRIRWSDSLSLGPDGWMYLADSAIPEQVLKSRDYILSKGPYFIFRFQPPGLTATADTAR
jgi:sugar lactone lactonase YvrE